MKLIDVVKAKDGVHKYTAHFITNEGRNKTVKFGAKGYEDYTIHKDKKRKELYLARHGGMGEDWNNPMTAGALSKHLLWNLPTFEASLADFRRRFSL